MANPQHPFKVIEGGSGGRTDKALIDTGTVGKDKPKLTRPKASGGGRGGGTQAVSIAKLEESVGRAWKAIGLVAVAGGAAFLFMLDRVDDKFEANSDKLDTISRDISGDISDLRVEVVRNGHVDEQREASRQVRPPTEGDGGRRSP